MTGDVRVWLWEAGHATGVTKGDLRRAMDLAEAHLTGEVTTALVERAVVVDGTWGGLLHIRTGTRWTAHTIGGGVQWTEGISVQTRTALPLKRDEGDCSLALAWPSAALPVPGRAPDPLARGVLGTHKGAGCHRDRDCLGREGPRRVPHGP